MKVTDKDRTDAENALRIHSAKFPTPLTIPSRSDFEDTRDMRDPAELGAAILAVRVGRRGIPRKGRLTALLSRYGLAD